MSGMESANEDNCLDRPVLSSRSSGDGTTDEVALGSNGSIEQGFARVQGLENRSSTTEHCFGILDTQFLELSLSHVCRLAQVGYKCFVRRFLTQRLTLVPLVDAQRQSPSAPSTCKSYKMPLLVTFGTFYGEKSLKF